MTHLAFAAQRRESSHCNVEHVHRLGEISQKGGIASTGLRCPRIYSMCSCGLVTIADWIGRYKYFLFLAQDCNFRLINRNISSAAKDPILGDGFGYFVNHEKYAEFLRAHVSEEEISSCSGFQAMFLANRKRVKWLRTTGVGGVTCARHNMWRPNGIGDLQLGERCTSMLSG